MKIWCLSRRDRKESWPKTDDRDGTQQPELLDSKARSEKSDEQRALAQRERDAKEAAAKATADAEIAKIGPGGGQTGVGRFLRSRRGTPRRVVAS